MSKQTDLINIPDVITVSGSNVGIGTQSPSALLEVASGAPTITLNADGQATNKKKVRLAASQYTAGDFNIQQMNDDGTTIALTAMTIKNGGNVGIGTSSPTSLLQVQGNGVTIKLDGTANTSRQINLRNTGTAEGQIQTDGNMHFIQEDANRYMRFSTNNTERMKIDASGRVTMPYQPAFTAHGTSATYHSVTSLGGAGSYIPFSNAVTNIGNQYNSSNFRFSAPVAGMYHFSYAIYTRTGTATEDIYSRFRVNNSSNKGYTYWYNQTGTEIHHTLSDSINIYLNAGDDMGVTISGSANADIYLGNNESRFSGFLIG